MVALRLAIDEEFERLTKSCYDAGVYLDFDRYDAECPDLRIQRMAIARTIKRIFVENDLEFPSRYKKNPLFSASRLRDSCPQIIDRDIFLNGPTPFVKGEWTSLPSGALVNVSTLPDWDELGHFKYAFLNPPYAPKRTAKAVFEEMVNNLIPKGDDVTIYDWKTAALAPVSQYFDDGLEWWGVFLFTLWNATCRTITVVMASRTD